MVNLKWIEDYTQMCQLVLRKQCCKDWKMVREEKKEKKKFPVSCLCCKAAKFYWLFKEAINCLMPLVTVIYRQLISRCNNA